MTNPAFPWWINAQSAVAEALTPDPFRGRGAWTTVGKGNRSRYYEWIKDTTPDGWDRDKDVNFEAVNRGVAAIQRRVNAYGAGPSGPSLATEGIFGPKTKAGVQWVQAGLGLRVDGRVGAVTARAIWRDLITWFAGAQHVPAYHLWGMMLLESAADPGAVGFTTPSDRGLSQINLVAHSNITVEEAFDPVFALEYAAVRLGRAREQFDEKGVMLQDLCSIAQHNSPKAARQWYEVGWVGPDEKIAKYVGLVLQQAATY